MVGTYPFGDNYQKVLVGIRFEPIKLIGGDTR